MPQSFSSLTCSPRIHPIHPDRIDDLGQGCPGRIEASQRAYERLGLCFSMVEPRWVADVGVL